MAAAKSGSRERGRGSAAASLRRPRSPPKRPHAGRRGPQTSLLYKGTKNSRLCAPVPLNLGCARHVENPHPPPPAKGNGAGRLKGGESAV